jgi:protein SCO1
MRPLATTLSALTLLALAGCGSQAASSVAPSEPPPFRGLAVAEPSAAPPFSLRDQDGKLVRLRNSRSTFTVIAFLYTHCRDVCPLIADHLNDAAERLAAAGYPLRVLAVSVDPRGDTQAAVRRFVSLHRLTPRFRYLRGSAADLRPVWRAYHVAVDPTNPSAAIDHSAFEVLVDRTGVERLYYTSTVTSADVVHDVKRLATA